MKKFIKSNQAFFLCYTVFLLLLFPFFLLYTKAEIHLAINKYHAAAFDYFFRIMTFFGDGITPFIFAVALTFFSFRKSITIAATGTLAGLLAQFLKRMVFTDMPRPARYFEGIYDLHLIEGVSMNYSYSFPSGHSATAFALFLCLAGYVNQRSLKLLMFLMALIVAFSRVYLSQHFLVDIYAGSIIGVISAIILIPVFNKLQNTWLDKSFINLARSKD